MRKQLRFQASAATDPGLPGQCMLTALTEDYKVLRGHYYKRGQEQCQPNEVADYIWWSASENQPRPGCVLINSPKALHSGTTAAFVYTERKMSCLLSSANKFSGEGYVPWEKLGFPRLGQESKATLKEARCSFPRWNSNHFAGRWTLCPWAQNH